jgi:lycopene cyclase domain-containing protein
VLRLPASDTVRHYTYLVVLVGCLVATLPLEVVLRTRVYARWRRLLCSLVPTVLVFAMWDMWAITTHAWSYDRRYLVGARLLGKLPIEELLFFLVVPTCAILTLEAVRRRRPHWQIGDEQIADEP